MSESLFTDTLVVWMQNVMHTSGSFRINNINLQWQSFMLVKQNDDNNMYCTRHTVTSQHLPQPHVHLNSLQNKQLNPKSWGRSWISWPSWGNCLSLLILSEIDFSSSRRLSQYIIYNLESILAFLCEQFQSTLLLNPPPRICRWSTILTILMMMYTNHFLM